MEIVNASDFSLQGKNAIVVGSASGIGQGIALGFASHGGNVLLADINEQRNNETYSLIKNYGGKYVQMRVDSTSLDDVRNMVAKAREKFGTIDALYVVPSINVRKKIADYSYEEFQKVINVNLLGSFMLMKEVSAEMVKEGVAGSIVVLSSIRSQVVEPGQSIYAATKAGVVQIMKTLAAELGPNNIRVNAIAPGVVDTPLTSQIKNDPDWYNAYANKTAFRRWASVNDIAGPSLFLAMPASSYITGTVIFVDGGWMAIDGRYEPKL